MDKLIREVSQLMDDYLVLAKQYKEFIDTIESMLNQFEQGSSTHTVLSTMIVVEKQRFVDKMREIQLKHTDIDGEPS